MKQLAYLKKWPTSHGGVLLRTTKGRSRPRPLAVKHTMHLVLRSSKAKGGWSFRYAGNEGKIRHILKKFGEKYAVKILSSANVGNHLHLQIKLANRHSYRPFIRAVTAAIAMAVTKLSRWNRAGAGKFWDYRPFTRIVEGFKAFLRLQDYIDINKLEGLGRTRAEARLTVAWQNRVWEAG